jgi:hypothetical protein
LTGKLRTFGTGIYSISEANQPTLTDQFSQGTKYLVFTAKIDEFARQKYGVTLSGNPFFNLFSQRLSAGHDLSPCKNPTSLYAKNPTICKAESPVRH